MHRHVKGSGLLPAALLAVLLPVSSTAWANDQVAVIGAGVGAHDYSTTDEVRGELVTPDDELDTAGLTQIYGEWYAFGDIGLGLRGVALSSSRTYTDSSGNELEQTVSLAASFITLQWIALGGESYARLGFLGGAGSAEYETEYKTTVSGTETTVSDTTDGSATLVGAFIDWGGADFGARFGVHSLETDLDDLNGAEADASGTSYYLDLRWAFD